MAGPLTLDEAKEGLNYKGGPSEDSELQSWLDAATELVESIVGPVVPRAIEEYHPDLWQEQIYLRQTPVISIEGIDAAAGGAPVYVADDLRLEALSGRVSLVYGGTLGSGAGGMTVRYTAGRAEVPESIRRATVIILEHLWKQQRGWASGAPSARGQLPEPEPQVPMGFVLPNRAAQLLEPHTRVAIA